MNRVGLRCRAAVVQSMRRRSSTALPSTRSSHSMRDRKPVGAPHGEEREKRSIPVGGSMGEILFRRIVTPELSRWEREEMFSTGAPIRVSPHF